MWNAALVRTIVGCAVQACDLRPKRWCVLGDMADTADQWHALIRCSDSLLRPHRSRCVALID